MMTIMDFMNEREQVQEMVDAGKDIRRCVDSIAAVIDNDSVPEAVVSSVKTNLAEIVRINGMRDTRLGKYSYLLDEIARNSELEWPPVCKK